MSTPTGTVQRWVSRVGDMVPTIQSHETMGYVLAKDYDLLSAQAVALAEELKIEIEMRCSRGDCRPQDSPIWQLAQAILDAQGRKG